MPTVLGYNNITGQYYSAIYISAKVKVLMAINSEIKFGLVCKMLQNRLVIMPCKGLSNMGGYQLVSLY